MSSTVSRKACQVIAVFLACLAVGATLACQIHFAPLNHEHAMPDTRHPGPASHSGVDFSCVVAVLPVMMVFLAWFFAAFYATPRMLKHTVPVFPPFIPPRHPAL